LGLKIKSQLTVFFVLYVIALSFVPLIHVTLLGQNTWLGYGTGAYAYQTQRYFVLFNDPYDGSSKPHIHINPDFAPNARINLIEFSDWTSWVDGLNLFNDFNITIRGERGQALDVTYSRPGITLHKFVTVSPAGVTVKMVSTAEFSAHIELWRWVMTSVNGISIEDTPKPIQIPNGTLLEFTFQDERLRSDGNGRIVLSRVPARIMIWPHEKGFNRITIDFVNSEMALTVSGSMLAVGSPPLTWDYADLPYVMPVIAVSVVVLYLLVERYARTHKNRVSSSSS